MWPVQNIDWQIWKWIVYTLKIHINANTIIKNTCQSPSSVAIFSCSSLVSRYSCRLSGADRSGRSLWSRYLLRLARWFLIISHNLRNSVVRLYCLQNWKARCAVIYTWHLKTLKYHLFFPLIRCLLFTSVWHVIVMAQTTKSPT